MIPPPCTVLEVLLTQTPPSQLWGGEKPVCRASTERVIGIYLILPVLHHFEVNITVEGYAIRVNQFIQPGLHGWSIPWSIYPFSLVLGDTWNGSNFPI